MNPLMAAFPQQDMFGFANLLQGAVQNPDQGAAMLAGLGIEPPSPSVFGAGPSVSPFANIPDGTVAPTPNERVAGAFGDAAPMAPMAPPVQVGGPANPFPEPVAGANPFPTPYGSPATASPNAPAPATASDPKALTNMLKGVSVPAAPEPQKVSSPSAPAKGAAPADSGLMAMLTQIMSGQKNPVQPLRLGQTLGIGGR